MGNFIFCTVFAVCLLIAILIYVPITCFTGYTSYSWHYGILANEWQVASKMTEFRADGVKYEKPLSNHWGIFVIEISTYRKLGGCSYQISL